MKDTTYPVITVGLSQVGRFIIFCIICFQGPSLFRSK